MEPECLPSGRYRALAWNAKTQRKEVVRNPAPGSRGTWLNKDEARTAAKVREQQVDDQCADGGVPVTRRRRDISFGEYAWTWLATLNGEQASLNTRTSEVRALAARFGHLPIANVTATDVQAWLADTRDTLALNTRSQRLGVLRTILNRAMREGLREGDPTEGITLPKPPKTRRGRVRYLSEAELARVLEASPEWYRPAILLAHDCGLRAAEVAGLRWLRLDLDSDMPTIVIADVMQADRTLRNYPKGKESAAIPLTPRVVEALKRLRAQRSDLRTAFVIRNSRDGEVPPKRIGDQFREARIKAELTDEPVPTFHHLRHMTATNLVEAGAQATIVQAILRHGTLETSQRYIREAELDVMRAAMNDVAHSRIGVVSLSASDQQAG